MDGVAVLPVEGSHGKVSRLRLKFHTGMTETTAYYRVSRGMLESIEQAAATGRHDAQTLRGLVEAVGGKLDHDGEPALLIRSGKSSVALYFRGGQRHREDGPALIEIAPGCIRETCYRFGVIEGKSTVTFTWHTGKFCVATDYENGAPVGKNYCSLASFSGVSIPQEDQIPNSREAGKEGIVLRLNFWEKDNAVFATQAHACEKITFLFVPKAQIRGIEEWLAAAVPTTARELYGYLTRELHLQPHRPRGPAVIERYNDGSVLTTCYRHGVRHAEDEPARVVRCPDGSVTETRYIDGRIDGDGAVRWFDPQGRLTREADYRRGLQIEARDIPSSKRPARPLTYCALRTAAAHSAPVPAPELPPR